MARTTDLTSGNIRKKLLLFAAPLLLSSLVQQLYSTVDLIYVGNFMNKSASAAIGASSQLITCIVGFFCGMSVGAGVVAAHIFGAQEKEKLSKTVHTTIAMSIAGGVTLFVVGFFFAPTFLELVNTPESLQASATSYLRIYFLSLVPIFVYNLGAGVLRALGNSTSPLYAQLIGGIVNVILNYVFITHMENGVNAVAWATLIAQTVAALLLLYSLTKQDPTYAFNVKKMAIDGPQLKQIVIIGLPAGIQSLLITISNVVVQYFINSFGEDAIAAFTAYFKVELLVYLPTVAFGQAVMTLAGQNMGAKNYHRVHEGIMTGLKMCIGVTIVISIILLCCGTPAFRVFNKEADVIALGCQIIHITFPFYFLYATLQVLGDGLRGAGKTQPPLYIVMANICIIRTLILFQMVPHTQSIQSIAMVYPITWVLTVLCLVVYYRHFYRQYTHPQLVEKKTASK